VLRLKRIEGTGRLRYAPVGFEFVCSLRGGIIVVADVVEDEARKVPSTVDAAGLIAAAPETSQSPAESEILVMFNPVPLVALTDDPVAVMYSPMLPAFASLFVVVPTIPAV